MFVVVVAESSKLAQLFLVNCDDFAAVVGVAAAVAGGVVVVVGIDVVVVAVCWTSVGLAAKFLIGICNLTMFFISYFDFKICKIFSQRSICIQFSENYGCHKNILWFICIYLYIKENNNHNPKKNPY